MQNILIIDHDKRLVIHNFDREEIAEIVMALNLFDYSFRRDDNFKIDLS